MDNKPEIKRIPVFVSILTEGKFCSAECPFLYDSIQCVFFDEPLDTNEEEDKPERHWKCHRLEYHG